MSKKRASSPKRNDGGTLPSHAMSDEDNKRFEDAYSQQLPDSEDAEADEAPWRYADEWVDLSAGQVDDMEVIDVDDDVQGLPLIAIVGRPNVGKSRLFNRMTRTRFAIVADEEGITRDRQYGEGHWDERGFQVVDTGGFDPDSTDNILQQMRAQVQIALDEADLVFFVVDARAGVTPADREIWRILRQINLPVYVLGNKVDNEEQELLTNEFYELGLDTIYPISAEHGSGYEALMDDVRTHLPPHVERHDLDRIHVAVVGRPNAGKSTFINQLLGEDRLLTSDQPGTTRDAVNTLLQVAGQDYLFIDTAGIRRKRSIHELVEKYSVVQAFKALDRADVAIIMLDATKEFSAQDQRIAGLAHQKGCGIIFVLNKWDLVKKDHKTAQVYLESVRDFFRFAQYAPVVTISAATGQRVHRILPMINAVHEQYTRRISTSAVNDFLERALRRRSPPQRSTRKMKFYYATQVAARPPTFMFSVNNPELMHFSYERFLINQLREQFGFQGVPLKVFYRGRTAAEED